MKCLVANMRKRAVESTRQCRVESLWWLLREREGREERGLDGHALQIKTQIRAKPCLIPSPHVHVISFASPEPLARTIRSYCPSNFL